MQTSIRFAVLISLLASVTHAEMITIDFDDLPPIQFSVQLANGSTVEATPTGSLVLISPDGTRTEIPAELVPDGVLPAPGEVPIAAPLPESVSQHVTFSTNANAALYYFSGGEAVGTSAPNNITAAVDPNSFPYSADLFADFTTPVNNLTFTVSSDNDRGDIAQVVVRHADGQVDQLPVLGNADFTDSILIDLTGYRDVVRIEVTDITDTFGLSYDDFSFEPTSVPEPSGLPIGLFAVFALFRRRVGGARLAPSNG